MFLNFLWMLIPFQPLMDFAVACFWIPSNSPYHSGSKVPWIDCTSPGAPSIWWQLFFWWNSKREAAESLKGNLLCGLLSQSIILRWYFGTGFRYGNECVCLAQKLFSAFKWERDGKGEDGLSSSKALSTLGFFLPIFHHCLHGYSSIHSGTNDSSGTGREANVFR